MRTRVVTRSAGADGLAEGATDINGGRVISGSSVGSGAVALGVGAAGSATAVEV